MRASTASLLLALPFQAAMAVEFTPLIELLERGQVTLQPKGLGGHSGDCLSVDVRSTSSTPLRTSIPAGWVFVSEVPEVQDLIVMREEAIALAPRGQATVTCRAFCCEASNSGPDAGEVYRKGHPAGKKLIALAQLVDSSDYADNIVQSAVWVLSNGHDIGSLGALDGSAEDTLRNQLSLLSGQPAPRYTVRYAPSEHAACSGRPESISRIIDYTTAGAQRLTVIVKNDAGRLMEVMYDRELMAPGQYSMPVTAHVLDWPKGRYAFYVYTDEASPVSRLPFVL